MDPIITAALVVFVCKGLDQAFNTLKAVFLYKNKFFLSSVFNTVSTVFFTVAVVKTANAGDGMWTLGAIALATFLGTWLPAALLKKMEPDKLWIYEITSTTMTNGKEFADELRRNNIPVRTAKTYDKNMNKVLSITAYSQSKAVSRLIEDSMPADFRWIFYCPSAD